MTPVSTLEPPAAPDRVVPGELALIAFDRARMPMVITDPTLPDNPVVLVNTAFLAMCGYSRDEVIGRNCRFLQGAATDRAAVARVRDALAAREDTVIDLLNYRKDGSMFWNRLFISPINDCNGKVRYFFASQHDVSEEAQRRALEAAERRLLREVDHRAKNALALVQGIVRLSCADDARTYSASVQGRVEALAQAHIILSDAKWHDVPLGRIASAATGHFPHGRIAAAGPLVEISAAHVQPLLLAFHEILINAAQHGGLSCPAGSVTFDWHVAGDRVTVDLTERGGPPALPPSRQGYGLKMVDAFVTRQLRGAVDRDWSDDGLATRLSFPRAAAAAYAA